MDEPAWEQAVAVPLDLETQPGENIPAHVQTTAYLVEDGHSLYIAFDAQDPESKMVRAYLRDRDSAWNDDMVGIVLDTYNDERRAFEFFSNPLGVQMDLTNDDVNKYEDSSWDAIWDSAGVINSDGYVVEMEIPLNQLRFPATGGLQTWGIDLLRFYPRDKRFRFSNNPQDRSRNCYLCNFGRIEGLKNIKPARDLEITPTLTAIKTDFTSEPGVVPLASGDTDVEAGVSVSWGITPDMTANFAINPDFSQVEADIAQLDVNNQFALFFPEKRPFFLEGADYFSTPLIAVFTRTIVDPTFGAKLTGKRGSHTYGAVVAEDEITNLIFPGSLRSDETSLAQPNTSFTGRYSYGFGDASSIGTIVTTRAGDDYHNYVGGLDLQWKISDQHNLRAQYLLSETEYPEAVAADFAQPLDKFSGNAAIAEYNYGSRNWHAMVAHYYLDPGFRADAGFEPQVDIEKQEVGGGYNWHGTNDSWWTQIEWRAYWQLTHDETGQLLQRELQTSVGISGRLQSFTRFGFETRDVFWDGRLFEENDAFIFMKMQPFSGLSVGGSLRYGDRVDYANSQLGVQRRIRPFVEWNLNRHLLLKLDGTKVYLDSEEGKQIFDAAVYDLRLTWQFSRRSFLRFSAQYHDIERNLDEYIDAVDERSRNVGRQLLYSYKLNPQTVFFLGYSDNQLEYDDLSRLETSDRTWFMKIGYAWMP